MWDSVGRARRRFEDLRTCCGPCREALAELIRCLDGSKVSHDKVRNSTVNANEVRDGHLTADGQLLALYAKEQGFKL